MISTVLSIGVASLIMLGGVSLSNIIAKNRAWNELSVDSIGIRSDLNQIFKSVNQCESTFLDFKLDTSKVSSGPLTPALAQPISLSDFITANKKIGTVDFKDYAIGKLKITGMNIQLTDNFNAPLYSARVYIDVGRQDNEPLTPPISAKILNLYFNLDPSSGKIQGCTTDTDNIGDMISGDKKYIEGDGQKVVGSDFDWPDAIVCERPGRNPNLFVLHFKRTKIKAGKFIIRYQRACGGDCSTLNYLPDGKFASREFENAGVCNDLDMKEIIDLGYARFF